MNKIIKSTKLVIIFNILFLLIYINKIECMIFDKDFSFSNNYYMVQQFGFDADGSADINVLSLKMDDTIVTYDSIVSNGSNGGGGGGGGDGTIIIPNFNITLWICQDRDYQSIIGSSPSNTIETKLCQGTATLSNCPINNIQLYQGFNGSFQIKDSDMYRVIILKCSDSRTASLKLSYTLENQNGQLERGYLQLPTLYTYIMIIFCIFFATITIYWYIHKTSLNILHFILYFVLIFKLILFIVQYTFWTNSNNNGIYNLSLWYIQNIFYAFSETTFFMTLYTLSRGLKVTRQTLSRSEVKAIAIVSLFLCGILLFFRFYNDIYYFLSLMILYFFMMPKIFTNITKNLRILYSHSILSRYINNVEQVNNLAEKKKVFTNLRTSVVLYLGAILFVNSLRIVMVWYLYWLSYTISEPIFIVMITFLCWSFRPNNSSLSIFRNPNLDAVDFSEITRNIESLLNPNIDPVLLSTILEIKSFNPNSCHLIAYPNNYKYSLAILDESSDNNNNNNNKKD